MKRLELNNNLLDREEKSSKPLKKKGKLVLTFSAIFFVGLGLIALFGLILPGLSLLKSVEALGSRAKEAKLALESKDIGQIRDKVRDINDSLLQVEANYQKIALAKLILGLRSYYLDGERVIVAAKSGVAAVNILIDAIEPYQDFLGLKGGDGDSKLAGGEKTTEERINFLIESVEELKPRLDDIEKELELIKGSLLSIDAFRYPETFRGLTVRSNLVKVQGLADEAGTFFKEGRPLLEKISWLLGKDNPRQYMFIFQNDAELRPTGGFWTAYGILKVDKGKVSPLISEDIYALDSRFGSTIPAPRPIKAYHKNVYYLNLRDINLSPDLPESVKEFIKNYQTIRGAYQFDGVFTVDTQVLVDLLRVLGRIGVSGWGNFGPEPDDRCWGCPQVVYQLELLADKPLPTITTTRKGFLAPLMHSLIANALGSPKEKVSVLAEVALKNLRQKHIMAFFLDEKLQKSVESLRVGGRVESFEGDYFHLNDTNFAGAKSNLFIEQNVKQEIRIEGEKIIKKITVEYKNIAPASDCNLERGGLCLNGLYRNWFRFYVPSGSKLIKMTGSEVEPVVYEELGKTVFEGFYGNKYPLYPQGSTRVTIEYELPFKTDRKDLQLLIQKQPGTKNPRYEFWLNGKKIQELDLVEDKIIDLGI